MNEWLWFVCVALEKLDRSRTPGAKNWSICLEYEVVIWCLLDKLQEGVSLNYREPDSFSFQTSHVMHGQNASSRFLGKGLSEFDVEMGNENRLDVMHSRAAYMSNTDVVVVDAQPLLPHKHWAWPRGLDTDKRPCSFAEVSNRSEFSFSCGRFSQVN